MTTVGLIKKITNSLDDMNFLLSKILAKEKAMKFCNHKVS